MMEHAFQQQILSSLGEIQEAQRTIIRRLRRISQKETVIMATLDQVLQDTKDESTLEDSIITLLQGVQSQLAAITAGALPADVQAKVDAVFANLEANKAKVTAAVTANTPPIGVPPVSVATSIASVDGTGKVTGIAQPGAAGSSIGGPKDATK